MQAPVAVGLGILKIVLPLDQGHVVLAQKGLGQGIDIRLEGAHHPHPRDVVDVLLNALHGQWVSPAQELIHNALRAFQAGVDGFDGAALKGQGHILTEHPEFRLHLHDGAAVKAHQLPVGPGVPLHPLIELLKVIHIHGRISADDQILCFRRMHASSLSFFSPAPAGRDGEIASNLMY